MPQTWRRRSDGFRLCTTRGYGSRDALLLDLRRSDGCGEAGEEVGLRTRFFELFSRHRIERLEHDAPAI